MAWLSASRTVYKKKVLSALRHSYRNPVKTVRPARPVTFASHSRRRQTVRTIIVTPWSELAALFWPWPTKNLDALLGTLGAAVERRAFLATSFALALAGEGAGAEVERGAAWALSARGMLRVILEAIVVLRGYRGRGRGREICGLLLPASAAPNGHNHSPTREPRSVTRPFVFSYLFYFIPPPPCTCTKPLLHNMYMYNKPCAI